MCAVLYRPGDGRQVGVLVLFPLRHLDGRLAGDVTDEEIDQNVFTVAGLIDGFV